MRLGLYTFASLALVGLISVFVYTLNPGYYLLEIAGINLSLPIAIWIALPMLLLLLVTIFHMLYHGTRGFFARRKWIKDANQLQDSIYWSLLHEPKKHNYAIENIKHGAALLSVSTIDANDSIEGLSDKLAKTVAWIKKIENGEYVDLAEKKVAKFMSKENPIVIKNVHNRLLSESSFADTVMSTPDNYHESVLTSAMKLMAENETLFKIRKYAKLFKRENMMTMLDRADTGEDIGLTADNVEYIAANMNMKCSDYMRLANSTLRQLTPDENLALFKKLSTEKELAQNAYLYLLFKYEMLDAVKAYLEESGEDEFITFRALYILKRDNHNFRSTDIVHSALVCNED